MSNRNQAKSAQEKRASFFRGPPGMRGRRIEKAKNPRDTLNRLFIYLKPFKLQLSIVILLVIASTLISLIGPYLIGVAIDQFIATSDVAGLIYISLLMLTTYVAGTLASIGSGWIMATIGQKVLKNLRKDLFEHLQTLSLRFFDKRPTGDLMSRLTNDIDTVNQALTQNVTRLISNLLTSVGILLIMFRLNFWLALGSLIIFPILVGLTAFVGKRTRSGFRSLQMNMGRLNGIMEENLSGEREIIAFGQQKSVLKTFKRTNNIVRDSAIKASIYALLMGPLLGIINNANIAGVG